MFMIPTPKHTLGYARAHQGANARIKNAFLAKLASMATVKPVRLAFLHTERHMRISLMVRIDGFAIGPRDVFAKQISAQNSSLVSTGVAVANPTSIALRTRARMAFVAIKPWTATAKSRPKHQVTSAKTAFGSATQYTTASVVENIAQEAPDVVMANVCAETAPRRLLATHPIFCAVMIAGFANGVPFVAVNSAQPMPNAEMVRSVAVAEKLNKRRVIYAKKTTMDMNGFVMPKSAGAGTNSVRNNPFAKMDNVFAEHRPSKRVPRLVFSHRSIRA